MNFFMEHENFFARTAAGGYVYTGPLVQDTICRFLTDEFKKQVVSAVRPFDIVKPEYCIIIGGCLPKDNMLLDFKDSAYFPKKLEKLIESKPSMRYFLKESDIEIDMDFMNQMFETLFRNIFSDPFKTFGKNYKNIIVIRHNRLDCYAIFKILKYLYGAANCINMSIDVFKDDRRCLISVNDIIKKYVASRQKMNRSQEFKNAVADIKQYLELAGQTVNI